MFRNPYADTLIVLLIVVLFLGPKRLPTLGRGLGQGLKEFKDGITGKSEVDGDDDRPELTQASSAASEPATPPAQTSTPADRVS
jgi:sec-independent protein translocase protein TatA